MGNEKFIGGYYEKSLLFLICLLVSGQLFGSSADVGARVDLTPQEKEAFKAIGKKINLM